jgi:hypothetical protein
MADTPKILSTGFCVLNRILLKLLPEDKDARKIILELQNLTWVNPMDSEIEEQRERIRNWIRKAEREGMMSKEEAETFML